MMIKKIMAAVAIALVPIAALAGNYATCILDNMPGMQNNLIAVTVANKCEEKYPLGLDGVIQGSGRGIFSYNSGFECGIKKASGASTPYAAFQISEACNKLYDPPRK